MRTHMAFLHHDVCLHSNKAQHSFCRLRAPAEASAERVSVGADLQPGKCWQQVKANHQDKSRVTAKIAEAVKQWGVTAKAPKRGIYMLSHKYGTSSPSFTCVCATPMDLTGLICVYLEQADAPSACQRSSTTSKQHSASPALSAKTDQLHACLV